MLLRRPAPLAQVRGAYNAIYVVGDAVGDTLFYGQGAGQMPTASAVVADLIDLAIGRTSGRSRHYGCGRATGAAPGCGRRDGAQPLLPAPAGGRPAGRAGRGDGVLAQQQISIASVIQHETPDDAEGGACSWSS